MAVHMYRSPAPDPGPMSQDIIAAPGLGIVELINPATLEFPLTEIMTDGYGEDLGPIDRDTAICALAAAAHANENPADAGSCFDKIEEDRDQ